MSLGPWLGIVTEVYRKIVLRIKNGSRCICACFEVSYTLFTPAKHILLNWFLLIENHKQGTEKLNFP